MSFHRSADFLSSFESRVPACLSTDSFLKLKISLLKTFPGKCFYYFKLLDGKLNLLRKIMFSIKKWKCSKYYFSYNLYLYLYYITYYIYFCYSNVWDIVENYWLWQQKLKKNQPKWSSMTITVIIVLLNIYFIYRPEQKRWCGLWVKQSPPRPAG